MSEEKKKMTHKPQSQVDQLKLYEIYLNMIKETDEISFKLLGFVPLLSGVSIYSLFSIKQVKMDNTAYPVPFYAFVLTGLFGAFITFFIYRWEIRNIQTCKAIRNKVKEMETWEGGGAYSGLKDE